MKFSGIKILLILLLFCTFSSFYIHAQSNIGEIQIYIFSESGMPMEGVTTDVNGDTYASDESGLLTFTHPPGAFDFVLKYEGAVVSKVTIPIRQGQTTEVIVTASKQAAEGAADVETAEAEEIKSSEERKQIDESLPTGTLTGKITHIETGEPIPQATIIFRGIDFETTTDENGEFAANIPEGNYSISVIHSDFSTQTMDEIDVEVDETTTIAMELTPSAIDLGEIPVFAVTEVRVQGGIANLIEETRNSEVVLNLIGTEQISRMGDSDAAAALRRVTGLTVVDGRFIYVRGMGERYSSSYLNGALLPSPEVDKRVVPLDLFPTSVIESMAVQKTYSPDMFGDFGGGAVRLRTMGIPEDRYKRRLRAHIKASVSYDMGSTFTEQLLEDPGRLDWLGIDDGSRRLPETIEESSLITEEIPGVLQGYTAEEIEQLAETFPNTWSPSSRMLWPDFDFAASLRDKVEINEKSNFGYSLSLLYKNSFNSVNDRKNTSYVLGAGENLKITTDYLSDSASHNIDIGALADFSLDLGDNFGIEATSLLTRITEGNTFQYEGYFSDEEQDILVTNQEWVEKMLFSQTLGGKIGLNILNQTEIEWQYAYSLANRYQPDTRSTRYDSEIGESDYSLSPQADGATRSWTTVTDHVHDGSFQFNIPVFFTEKSADFIEFGGHALYRTRKTDLRWFQWYYEEGDFTQEELTPPPEELFTPENINPDGFELRERTVATDNYTASQMLFAGFLASDILLFGSLRFNPGARFEYSLQRLDTFDLFTGQTAPTASLQTIDVLPSVNFTLPIGKKMQVRLGGSKTVNRPDFRELSPQPKILTVGEGQLIGNPDLKKADIFNADLRLEAYLAEEENISIGSFFKYFNNAIELKRKGGAGNQAEPDNIPRAYNLGGELEWQLTFRFISDMLRNSMRNLNIDSFEREKRVRRFLGGMSGFFRDLHTSGNVSIIWSQIDYGEAGQGINTTAERPLQGQSPYVINVSLGYRNSVSWSQHQPVKLSLFFNYNVFGKRISALGVAGLPDYYEQPFHQLDMVLKQRFSEIFSISIKAKNILNLPARETIGPEVTEDNVINEYKKGRSFSFGVSFDL